MNSYSSSLDWIDTQEQILLARLKQWITINTFSLNIKGLEAFSLLLQSDFQTLGGEMTSYSLPAQKKLNSEGSFYTQNLGPCLMIRKRPQAPIQILLGGHMDTVYPPSDSSQTLDHSMQDIWKGPGIADMKGGIAILLTALEALERSPFAASIGWEVILNSDEEIGSPGSASVYAAAAQYHHCGLIFEPSLPDGAFVSERKGSITYTVVVRGKAAHVGRDYRQGRSAVLALTRFISQLADLQTQENLILNVTDLEGKGPVNIVPPLASCRINLRSSNVEALQQACRHLQQIAIEYEQEGIQFEIWQETFRMPKSFDLKTKRLFNTYGHCAEALNIPFHFRPTGGVCDGNILAEAGLPTLDTAGAVGGALHTCDEYLLCSSLRERAKLAALFLFKLASKEIRIDQEGFYYDQ